jgi:hypothetical protein
MLAGIGLLKITAPFMGPKNSIPGADAAENPAAAL